MTNLTDFIFHRYHRSDDAYCTIDNGMRNRLLAKKWQGRLGAGNIVSLLCQDSFPNQIDEKAAQISRLDYCHRAYTRQRNFVSSVNRYTHLHKLLTASSTDASSSDNFNRFDKSPGDFVVDEFHRVLSLSGLSAVNVSPSILPDMLLSSVHKIPLLNNLGRLLNDKVTDLSRSEDMKALKSQWRSLGITISDNINPSGPVADIFVAHCLCHEIAALAVLINQLHAIIKSEVEKALLCTYDEYNCPKSRAIDVLYIKTLQFMSLSYTPVFQDRKHPLSTLAERCYRFIDERSKEICYKHITATLSDNPKLYLVNNNQRSKGPASKSWSISTPIISGLFQPLASALLANHKRWHLTTNEKMATLSCDMIRRTFSLLTRIFIQSLLDILRSMKTRFSSDGTFRLYGELITLQDFLFLEIKPTISRDNSDPLDKTDTLDVWHKIEAVLKVMLRYNLNAPAGSYSESDPLTNQSRLSLSPPQLLTDEEISYWLAVSDESTGSSCCRCGSSSSSSPSSLLSKQSGYRQDKILAIVEFDDNKLTL